MFGWGVLTAWGKFLVIVLVIYAVAIIAWPFAQKLCKGKNKNAKEKVREHGVHKNSNQQIDGEKVQKIPGGLLVSLLIILIIVFYFIISQEIVFTRNPEYPPKIFTGNPNEEILGIPWGCSYDQLERILKHSPYPTELFRTTKDTSGATYSFHGNPQFPSTTSSIYSFNTNGLNWIMIIFFAKNKKKAGERFDCIRGVIIRELDEEMGVDLHDYDSLRVLFGKSKKVEFRLEYGANSVGYADNMVCFSAFYFPHVANVSEAPTP